MNRMWLSCLVPPLAVCRYGCAGCCAAPISVMWVAAVVSLIYGFAGGPASVDGISWATVSLGILLWLIASIWAITVIRGVKDKSDPKCSTRRSPICRLTKDDDNDDPMSELKNSTQ